MKWNNFTDKEVQNLDLNLVMMLDQARDRAGIPFIITSGFRTPEHNAEVGGAKNSAHLRGNAVDIKANNDLERYRILEALWFYNANRIGIYNDHIHVDNDPTLTPRVIWVNNN